MIKRNEPTLIFLNGHGDYDLVAGQDNDKLVCAEENDGILFKINEPFFYL